MDRRIHRVCGERADERVVESEDRLIPEAGWRPYREDPEVICECAELPWDPAERKAGETLDQVRYLAIRVRRRQGELFEDGTLTKHFAVVTNRFDSMPSGC